ncbi:MAG TPA: hypothetical protein VFT98_11985 [Myxococcota bacterium]|nr:hypothetical protein [Myxococcota bacterium]
MHRVLTFGALGLLLSACATTRIENVWVDPAATPDSFAFRQVITVAQAREGIRRNAEDALQRAMRAGPRAQAGEVKVYPSYTLLEDAELANVEQARRKVEEVGYDGVVIMRFVSSQQKVTVEPPSVRGFWGYYGRAVVYDPGSVRTDTIVKLQINIFSLKEDKLLWSGTSRTLNPREVDAVVADIAEAARADLQKRGLLP